MNQYSIRRTTDAGDVLSFGQTFTCNTPFICLSSIPPAVTCLLRTIFFAYGSMSAAKLLHRDLIENLLFVPLSFFDTTPSGRILNRFSKDLYAVDVAIPGKGYDLIQCFLRVFCVLIVVSYGTPFALFGLLPLCLLYYLIQVPL